jgi:hypothetical protein
MKTKPDQFTDAAELRQRPEDIVAAGILPAVSGGILPPDGERRE